MTLLVQLTLKFLNAHQYGVSLEPLVNDLEKDSSVVGHFLIQHHFQLDPRVVSGQENLQLSSQLRIFRKSAERLQALRY